MNLSPLLRSIPGMADIDKREAKLEKLRKLRADEWKADQERFEREEAKYRQRVAEAEEALKPRPRRHHRGAPDPMEQRAEAESFRQRRSELDEERTRLIGQYADTLTAQLLDREADALAKAREAVTVVDRTAAELESLREDLRRVNLAAGRADRTGGGSITAFTLVEVVHAGATLLAPTMRVDVTHMNGSTAVKRTPIPQSDGEFIRHKGRDYPSDARVAVDG